MPYFKNDSENVLFIHIPKTGGTSCENYLSFRFNIPLNYKSLFGTHQSVKKFPGIKSSLQHITYNQIVQYSKLKLLNIDFNNIKIFTIVRNPYERIISDLFFNKIININNSKMEVFNRLSKFLLSKNCDNHNKPQYIFVTDDNKNLIPNIHILKTENLITGMKNLGYTNFNRHDNTNENKNLNYYKYLNKRSINKINNFYHLDFILFNYDKIAVSFKVPAVAPEAAAPEVTTTEVPETPAVAPEAAAPEVTAPEATAAPEVTAPEVTSPEAPAPEAPTL